MKALPNAEWYRETILQLLYAAEDGSLSRRRVLQHLWEIFEQKYGTEWLEVEATTRNTNNTPRWEHRADSAKAGMVGKHLLKSDSPRGIWELAPEGRAKAKLVS